MNARYSKIFLVSIGVVVLLTLGAWFLIHRNFKKEGQHRAFFSALRQQERTISAIERLYDLCVSNKGDFLVLEKELRGWNKQQKELELLGFQLQFQSENPKLKIQLDRIEYKFHWLYHELYAMSFDEGNKEIVSNIYRYQKDVAAALAMQELEIREVWGQIHKLVYILGILALLVFAAQLVVFYYYYFRPLLDQHKLLKQVTKRQSIIFEKHLRNIDNLRYALRIEKDTDRKNDIFRFILEEIEGLEIVSKCMKAGVGKKKTIYESP